MRFTTCFGAISALSVAIILTGCDGKPSAVAGAGVNGGATLASYGAGAPAKDPRDLPVPQFQGKPLWAANRKHTAEENASYQFAKNGGDFGASSEADYVGKAHAFIDKPPRDVETLDRPNGDKLMYDPGGNIFAVVSRDGAPRTLFKPRGGAAYWAQTKKSEATGGKPGAGGEQG
jgi:pyocin large subunit-like protein